MYVCLGLGKMVISVGSNEFNKKEEKIFLQYGTILIGLKVKFSRNFI